MPDQPKHNDGSILDLTRREAIGRFALFGTAMAILRDHAYAQSGAPGSYSNAAIALPAQTTSSASEDDMEKAVKIARAMRSGPAEITRDATVAEIDHEGTMTVLRKGSNGWICTPGNENRVGDPPMCVDELGMQWFRDAASLLPENQRLRTALRDCVTCSAELRSTATTRPSIERVLPFRSDHTG